MNGVDVTDAAANAGGGTAAATFTIDATGPTPSSITPASSSFVVMPSNINVSFDESVLASSVTAADLGVSGTCSSLPAVSVSGVSGSVVNFTLIGAICASGETLIISSLGSDVTDLSGNLGSNTQVVTYTKDTMGPSVSSFSPATGTYISIPTSISINFSENLSVGSVSASDFTISGTCSILPTHSISSVSGQQVFINLAGAVCNNNQTVILSVLASGINDSVGNSGTGTTTVTYTVDNAGPTVSGFSPNSGAPPATLTISFSENLNASTVSIADFSLSGTCTSKTLNLIGVSGNSVDLDIVGAACASGEDVTITINAVDVADAIGNVGTGTSFVTFIEP